jgi:hypothetical protein
MTSYQRGMATINWPTTLQQAVIHFANPDRALATAIDLRWQGKPVTCPTCGSHDVHFIATRRVWRCKAQKHTSQQFSVKIGTVMEDSSLGLDRWMVAIWLLSSAKNGILSYELHRALGITQKSARFLLHRVRLALQYTDTGAKLGGDVESDETFIGRRARSMHRSRRDRMGITQGRSMAGNVAVMGSLQRGKSGSSRVRLAQVPTTNRQNVMSAQTPTRRPDGARTSPATPVTSSSRTPRPSRPRPAALRVWATRQPVRIDTRSG